jgi:hypothetical protein
VAEFNVAVVVEGVDLTDQTLEAVFASLPDAVPATIDSTVIISSPIEAHDAGAAARSLVAALRVVLPRAVPVRLDQDLVSISDIARRTERTRESVRLLVEGKRGPGSFPAAIGVVGDSIRIWPWAVVADWFRDGAGEDLCERGVRPEVAAAIDAELARARAHRVLTS